MMKKLLEYTLLLALIIGFVPKRCLGDAELKPCVDLITFSFDRPLQLQAFLVSTQKRVKGLNKIYILYRTSNLQFQQAYDRLINRYPSVVFIKQTGDVYAMFKPLLIQIMVERSQVPYLIFGVDDIVVTDDVDLNDCVAALESMQAYGFFLRLGKNITRCYTLGIEKDFALPPLTEVCKGIYAWQFNQGLYEWNYPHSFDMTLYRKSDIFEQFVVMQYWTPNGLDVSWNNCAPHEKIGLCYEHSKMINIPLNIVQENRGERNMAAFSPEELLEEFTIGTRIDIDSLYKFDNKAPHVHHIPQFIIERD